MVDLKSPTRPFKKNIDSGILPNLSSPKSLLALKNNSPLTIKRRTATEEVFDRIHSDIMNLVLKPGTKISEAEIAKRYAVSRQPVRDAFIRLSNMGLLLVRPQRATLVRKISLKEVSNARFLRMSIEIEVARTASQCLDKSYYPAFEANLDAQKKTVEADDFQEFQILDVEFHRLICLAADCEFAYQSISQTKVHIDRLCTIALSRPTNFAQAYDDHLKIYGYLKNGDVEGISSMMRTHMSRLDTTINDAKQLNEDFFTE